MWMLQENPKPRKWVPTANPQGRQGVKPQQAEGMVNGEASNAPLTLDCSKLKTLYLNSLPVPFLPARSDPAASPGPRARPSTRTAGRGEARRNPWHSWGCAPQNGPEHAVPHTPMLLHPCPTATGLPRACAWLTPTSGITAQSRVAPQA